MANVMRKFLKLVLYTGLILFFVPVVFTQAINVVKPNGRQFDWVSLGETSYEDIRFKNNQQDIDLGGMLFVPEGDGPFPAAVIIHGSGPSRRDSGWYLTITKYLQDNGVVVLLPDKRGSEQSRGDWRSSSFEDLATDTLAGIDFLREQEDIEILHIGIIGMSQGGRIAPLVARQSSEAAYVVNIVGGSLPGYESLYYEEVHNLRQMGFLPGISDLMAYPTSFILINVTDRQYWNSVGNFNPLPHWNEATLPALNLYGEADTNVPSLESARVLQELNKPNIEVIVYAGSGHALEDPKGQGNSIFRTDALQKILDFIFKNTSHTYGGPYGIN
ncbi:MAG: alpha/beta fold hydrolase [Chloroflexi bacterium]|nr:MAG: alpha/beta fold hydrolase [Chloroflexota bacterium]